VIRRERFELTEEYLSNPFVNATASVTDPPGATCRVRFPPIEKSRGIVARFRIWNVTTPPGTVTAVSLSVAFVIVTPTVVATVACIDAAWAASALAVGTPATQTASAQKAQPRSADESIRS
jgi:hypothetical protein